MTKEYELHQGADFLEITTPTGAIFMTRRHAGDAVEAEAMVERLNASDEYRGWTNRETWAANIHVNQEADVQAHWLYMAAQAEHDEKHGGCRVPHGTVNRLAHELERHYVEVWDYVLSTTNKTLERDRNMIRDVGSIDRVDWRSIAARLLSLAADIAERGRKKIEEAGR